MLTSDFIDHKMTTRLPVTYTSTSGIASPASTTPSLVNGSSSFSSPDGQGQGQAADLRHVIETTFVVLLYGGFSLAGIVTNVLNILVFRRQGLNDSVNIPLLGLAVSDLCSDVTMLWTTVCNILVSANAPPLLFDPLALYILTGIVPRIIFNRVSCWLTALISLQRCLCVTLPFRVKDMFRPRRVLSLTLGTAAVVFPLHMTVYISRHFSLTFDPAHNASRYVMAVAEEGTELSAFRLIFLFLFLPLVNFFTIIVCSALLVYSLALSTDWRKSNAALVNHPRLTGKEGSDAATGNDAVTETSPRNQNKSAAVKETRVTRMVTAMTILAVVCNTPSNVMLVASSLAPGFTEVGEYSPLFRPLYTFAVLLETINANATFWVYFSLSSKFKVEFWGLVSKAP